MVSKYFHFQANQFMSERISGVEGTKLDDDFHRWGRQTKSSWKIFIFLHKYCFLLQHALLWIQSGAFEFCSMEKKTDLFNELVDDLQIKTKEYLQVLIIFFLSKLWKNVALHFLLVLFFLIGLFSAQSYGPSEDGSS